HARRRVSAGRSRRSSTRAAHRHREADSLLARAAPRASTGDVAASRRSFRPGRGDGEVALLVAVVCDATSRRPPIPGHSALREVARCAAASAPEAVACTGTTAAVASWAGTFQKGELPFAPTSAIRPPDSPLVAHACQTNRRAGWHGLWRGRLRERCPTR